LYIYLLQPLCIFCVVDQISPMEICCFSSMPDSVSCFFSVKHSLSDPLYTLCFLLNRFHKGLYFFPLLLFLNSISAPYLRIPTLLTYFNSFLMGNSVEIQKSPHLAKKLRRVKRLVSSSLSFSHLLHRLVLNESTNYREDY
jgi:hypothetical protein